MESTVRAMRFTVSGHWGSSRTNFAKATDVRLTLRDAVLAYRAVALRDTDPMLRGPTVTHQSCAISARAVDTLLFPEVMPTVQLVLLGDLTHDTCGSFNTAGLAAASHSQLRSAPVRLGFEY